MKIITNLGYGSGDNVGTIECRVIDEKHKTIFLTIDLAPDPIKLRMENDIYLSEDSLSLLVSHIENSVNKCLDFILNHKENQKCQKQSM